MNFKDLLLPIGLALLTVWGLQTFIFKSNNGQQAHSFVAPRSQQMSKPLNTEIDFFDQHRANQAIITNVSTDWADVAFSSNGATIESLDFKRMVNGDVQTIQTIASTNEREQRFFLLALNEKTPFDYVLVDQVDGANDITLVYESKTDACFVRKTFVINKTKCNVDLSITIAPKKGESIEPRLFYQAPSMVDLGEADVISSVVLDGSGKFTRTGLLSLDNDRGWITPTLFGGDNRYFIHSLYADDNNFAGRAYYRIGHNHTLSAVLEAPAIEQETTWNMSFYVGPKQQEKLVAVNSHLEKTLNYYGMLAPISNLMLKGLKFFYDYVHNYGFAIILLTLFMKLLLLPFTWRSEKSMRKSKEMSKKLAYLRKQYKDDPQGLAREQAEVMKQYGAPMLGGCLPLLVQVPMFFALSRLLSNSFELYGAPMLWIPDLSAADPYYIFAILVTGSMLLNAMNVDKQQQFSMVAVAFVLGAVTVNLSAGLALYLSVSTALGMLQSKVIKAFAK